ncbi:MAG: hypothetical protein Q7R62_00800 [bacterium]|nr:hypothetical protein [bacterium]
MQKIIIIVVGVLFVSAAGYVMWREAAPNGLLPTPAETSAALESIVQEDQDSKTVQSNIDDIGSSAKAAAVAAAPAPEAVKDNTTVASTNDPAFAPVDCPPLKPALDATAYQGKLYDTHIHIAPIPDGPVDADDEQSQPGLGVNVSMADYACMLDVEGTSKVFAFFPVWEPMIPEFIAVVDKTMQKYPGRFVPFIMPPDHDDRSDGFPTVTADVLKEMLAIQPGLFQGYGEIGLYARGDHGGPNGAPELPPDSKRLAAIYPVVRDNTLIVYVHLGEGQQKSFEAALSVNPDINFIWHGDQLIPYENGVQNLKHIEEILSDHSNAFYGVDELYGDVWMLRPEVTKEEFIAHLQNKETLLKKDLATWKGFIERHPDQVLWGTDRGWSAPWSLSPDVAVALNAYSRAFIGRLDPAVQERFAWQNAEQLLK